LTITGDSAANSNLTPRPPSLKGRGCLDFLVLGAVVAPSRAAHTRPYTSAYSGSNRPAAFALYVIRRRTRPNTCLHNSWVPKARAQDVADGVGVLALGGHRHRQHALHTPPRLPGLPTVFITSRSRSTPSGASASRPGKRARYSALNSSISRAALEVAAQPLARLELGSVHEDGVGPLPVALLTTWR
jgi:hypothetical protein